MKNAFYLALVIALMTSCKPKEDYKVLLKDVLKVHDEVMADNEKILRNKRLLNDLGNKLDSLKKANPALDTLKERQDISAIVKQLEVADNSMSDWMHGFDPEVGSKSNEEAVAYYKEEKRKINVIDSLFKQSIKESDTYLQKFSVK
ncbi:hypothetical protein [Solitalea lacus]|uniref:hypothetical protein n=1 Tax=Solitalea lacus TaxID=2911172 RepID=UPI001ED9C9FB|nr:hypothetical protein [Solitalea lacus]UKJ06585.1 hypothetical protein L2B55_13730 [Solitalea lacus]